MEKYRATIHGNTIEWEGGPPSWLADGSQMTVDVTPVEAVLPDAPNGKTLVDILRKIADANGLRSVIDPVAWQREIRKDRPLPGRE